MTKIVKANILSFDIEEWFHVSNFEKYIKDNEWDSLEHRVNIGTDFFLKVLEENNIVGTFFMVGWVAERNERMVERISQAGHEVGIHGYAHKCITDQTPEEFEVDIKRAIEIVGGITGKPVRGYRAPSYTITPDTAWAIDTLKNNGIEYDTSLYPTSFNPNYGFPNSPRFPFKFENGLYEFPMSTFRAIGGNLPFASGTYFRLAPYFFTDLMMRILNGVGEYFTINIHPWEMDPDQKKIETGWYDNFKHYTNLRYNRGKFEKFARAFRFTTFDDYLKNYDFPTYRLNNGTFELV